MKYTSLILICILFLGCFLPLEDYISPRYGFGYVLGIIGASSTLILLTYSARKRFSILQHLSPLKNWMNVHIFFGVFAPTCILYHCRYSLGSANSNVALFAMLIVMSSGIIGRYLYHTNQKLFSMWHVAHTPFVYTMVISILIHIASSFIY